MNGSYESLRSSLKTYLEQNEELDFSDEDQFYDHTLPVKVGASTVVVPLESLLGAFFVEFGWKNGGPKLVKKLLSCHDYSEVMKVLGTKPEAAGSFIRKML